MNLLHSKPPAAAPRRELSEDERLLAWLDAMPPGEARAIRLTCGLTQADVARHLSVTAGLVTKWERGQRGMSRASALGYARLLRDLTTAESGRA